MNRYFTLLADQPVLRRLSLIQLLSYFGTWFSNVAIYTLLIQLEVSADVIAFTAALHFLPGVLQAPFSGVLIDRFEPKKVMLLLIITEIVTTLCFTTINNSADLILLYGLIFIRMGASSFYFTLEMALLPRILHVKALRLANEIHSIIWSFSYTVGMAVSGFVVYKLGITMAFILDAMLFVISLVLLIPLHFGVKPKMQHEQLWNMMRQTWSYLREHPLIAYLLILHASVGLTAFDALVALMVDQFYASVLATALALGLMHASRALGLIMGPLLLAKHMNHKRLFYLLLFQAFSLWLWALVIEYFYWSLLVSIVVGLSTTTLWSYTYTMLQHHCDEAFYGRIVAYNDMLFLMVAALTSLFIGIMAENGAALWLVTALLGVGFVLAALYFRWIQNRYRLKEIGA